MVLHTHFEKHEGMMNDIINNDALVQAMDEDEIAKIREELKNMDNNNDGKQIKRKEEKEKRDLKNNYWKSHSPKEFILRDFYLTLMIS